ncbi:sensor histidine kinase [Pedobacter jeongneungensis]|uniref:sensor histidine kinase n=1 Tax=Pedobacter jeongneungensis TaxID=947309 RepID=UPI0004690CA4|nr:histidine kinase [Pedobacter jeongneungensis]
MKKIIYLLFLSLSLYSFGQEKKHTFLNEANGNSMLYGITTPNSNCPVLLRVNDRTKWNSFGNPESSDPLKNNVFLGQAENIHLEMRIHKDSLKYYRYSIIENDSVFLVDDAVLSTIDFKWNNRSDFPDYFTMSLGDYNVIGKDITVKVYKMPQKFKVSTVIIRNKPLLIPKILNKTIFLSSINTQGLSAREMIDLVMKKGKQAYSFKKLPFEDRDTIVVNDCIQSMLIGINNTGVDFIYKVKIIRYGNDYPEETVLTTNNWQNSKILIDAEYFKKTGTYLVTIAPEIYRSMDLPRGVSWTPPGSSFGFTVVEKKENFFTSKDFLKGIIIGGFFGLISVLILNNRKKSAARILAQKSQEKEIAKLQLDSVRSQLNPHFLFNALAGIQNLMNKNEIDNANRYLSKFARLTRNVLDHKELISLTSEKTLLDDYLQMEQLRFGFQYNISASPDLDVENIEIPAMLLQPFVENAVKYGISEKGNDGKIEISFTKEGTDLVLSVKDNGDGFDTAKDYTGLGLALTKNRISLLNSIYKETPFLLDMKADAKGTLIQITINQWL